MAPHDDKHGNDHDAVWEDGSADDWEDDREDERDDDSENDTDSDDEPTIPCPYCRREILEDSPRCPFCEQYISAEDSPGPRKPLWVVATALICLATALWLVFVAF